jgi:hypothetical protein
MTNEQQNIKKTLNPKSIIAPLLIGAAVAGYFLYKNRVNLFAVDWSSKGLLFWLSCSIVVMAMRSVFYMWRLRLLTDGKLTWHKCFDVIVLWEFASCVTPTMVGGTAVAIYLLNKEKFSLGKSTSIVLITSFLDELFFVLMVPVLIFGVGVTQLFGFIETSSLASVLDGDRLFSLFFLGYGILVFYTILVGFGVIVQPHLVKRILVGIFKLPILKKWQPQIEKIGDDIIATSEDVKTRPTEWWFRSFLATALSWSSRYLAVNCLILAFFALDSHLLIYARQLIMWVVLLVTPTPGASGIAELMFSSILSDITTNSKSELLALFWRGIGYYPYLVLGVMVLPKWIKRVYKG